MILNNSRVNVIKRMIDGTSRENFNFEFGPKNIYDVEFLAKGKEDISYLLGELMEVYYKLDEAENKLVKTEDKLDTYERMLEQALATKREEIRDKVLLQIDNKYLIKSLKAIESICSTEGEKQNSDLIKIAQIVNEALEGTE